MDEYLPLKSQQNSLNNTTNTSNWNLPRPSTVVINTSSAVDDCGLLKQKRFVLSRK